MKNLVISILILLTGINLVFAQNDPMKPQTSVDKLEFMIGEWEGTGWMMTRNGKEEAIVKESAEYKLEKNIMVVEGIGTKTDSISNDSKVIHNAFGIIFYDIKNNVFSMNAYKNGESTQSEIIFIQDKVLQWAMKIPNRGEVRFTVDFNTKDKWKETGEFSSDGISWTKFLEMELTRKEN